jgi:WhiB family transcriptional regulator, redox-sensing transcriptional regulator
MRGPRQFENPSCAQISTDLFFPEQGEDVHLIRQIKNVCKLCPHQQECAEWGIQNERYGIWGGLSDADRKIVRRQRRIIIREEEIA